MVACAVPRSTSTSSGPLPAARAALMPPASPTISRGRKQRTSISFRPRRSHQTELLPRVANRSIDELVLQRQPLIRIEAGDARQRLVRSAGADARERARQREPVHVFEARPVAVGEAGNGQRIAN